MAIPPHTLNIYQRPKQGNKYLGHYNIFNYRHTISAIGWFDSATCTIAPKSEAEGDKFLENYLGCRVAIIVDNPCEPVWEGFINRITFGSGDMAFTISLDEMANRVAVKYDAAGTITTSTPTDTPSSQAVYGIKQDTLDIAFIRLGGTRITTLQGTILSKKAWPKASKIDGGDGLIHLELLGFFHTLDWEELINTNNTAISLTNMIVNGTNGVLPNLANGATFFDNTDFGAVATNATTFGTEEIRGKTAMDKLVEIQEVGDGTNYYAIGITPTDFNTGKRRLYYRVANANIDYHALRHDSLHLRNRYNKPIPPWTVKPDAGVMVTDWLSGGATAADDPRLSYITAIDYDADRQTVKWSGDDDLRAEGAFQLRRRSKSFNKKGFGAIAYK